MNETSPTPVGPGYPQGVFDPPPSPEWPPSERKRAWSTREIVVASVLAVAGGILFWGWGLLWSAAIGPFVPFPFSYLLVGTWMLGGIIVPYVIRKPGAALLGELVAAFVSMLPGNQWGLATMLSGLVQGIGAELVFAGGRWRHYSTPVLMLAGAVAGVCSIAFDSVYYGYWQMYSTGSILAAAVFVAVSGAVLGGLLSKVLADSLARTGVFGGLALGREQAARRT